MARHPARAAAAAVVALALTAAAPTASACQVSDKFVYTNPYNRGGLRTAPNAAECAAEAKAATLKQLFDQANVNLIATSSAGSTMDKLAVEVAAGKGSVVSVKPSYETGSSSSQSTTVVYQNGVKFQAVLENCQVANLGSKDGDDDDSAGCKIGGTIGFRRRLHNCERKTNGYCIADVTCTVSFQSIGIGLESGPDGVCRAPAPVTPPPAQVTPPTQVPAQEKPPKQKPAQDKAPTQEQERDTSPTQEPEQDTPPTQEPEQDKPATQEPEQDTQPPPGEKCGVVDGKNSFWCPPNLYCKYELTKALCIFEAFEWLGGECRCLP